MDKFDNGKFLIVEGLPPPQSNSIEIAGREIAVKSVIVGNKGRIGIELWKPL